MQVVGTIHVKQVYEIAKVDSHLRFCPVESLFALKFNFCLQLKDAEMQNGQDLEGLCRMICAAANTCGIKVVATRENEL